jgi:FlaA1/EpsC-like NDP-sugar epimerase
VIIAMPSAPGKVVRAIRDTCAAAGVTARTIPGLCALIDGTVTVSQLRKVEIDDLLRREPVEVDTLSLRGLLAGKRVLVTGGGGSIGSELCRQLLRCQPAELVVLGHGENSVFEIIQELQYGMRAGDPCHGGQASIRSAIADVRFGERILSVFQEFRPQIVFHAAAHKHVPLMEEHPGEAVTNNILGTRNVVAAARAVGVERFVMISTDKAVRPTSVMGASKRVAELLVRQAALQTRRPYVVVRFGNVLGSRGSVVLTFKKQIERGGPVTVTDPEMRRYFMTIPEAVQLVLQAAAQGSGGEVFMLEMGEPVRIVDLARDLIQLSGLQVGHDIDIVFSGTRPGEKLYEELFVAGEHYTPTAHPRIFSAGNGNLAVPGDLEDVLALLAQSAQRSDRAAILRCIHHLVPEYQAPRPTPAAPVTAAAPVPSAAQRVLFSASVVAQPAVAGDD